MDDWFSVEFFGTTIGEIRGLSQGCIPPFSTKNHGVVYAEQDPC